MDNQTWQTEWKTAPLATVQLCENENQTLEAFVVSSRLYAKFNCPVAHHRFFILATAHDCEGGLLRSPFCFYFGFRDVPHLGYGDSFCL